MEMAAIRNRFLTGDSSKVGLTDPEVLVGHRGLLQHIVASHLAETVHSQEFFAKLTSDLIRFAEQALVIRKVDALEEVSRVLKV